MQIVHKKARCQPKEYCAIHIIIRRKLHQRKTIIGVVYTANVYRNNSVSLWPSASLVLPVVL